MASKVRRLFDPRIPLTRIGFVIAVCIGSGIEGTIRGRLCSPEGSTKVLYVACVLVLSILLTIMTAKRLLDVGWSRRWTFVILGPVLSDIVFGIGNANSVILKNALYPLLISYIGYLLLVVVLCGVPSQREAQREAGTAHSNTVSGNE